MRGNNYTLIRSMMLTIYLVLTLTQCLTSSSDKKRNGEEEEARELMRKQSERLEEEIKKVNTSKQSRAGKLFKMKEVITGPKKSGQEAQAIRNPKGDLVVNVKQIKKVTLEHCLEVLKNNEPDKEFRELIKMKEDLHEILIKEDKSGSYRLTENAF